jgi:hypothetical protein
MVYKCCVPCCRGNYTSGGPKVRCFSFPKDEELRRKWLSAIHRENFIPSDHTKVCELHFTKEDYVEFSEAFDEKSGKTISVKLQKSRLKNSAVPSQFPNLPSYLTASSSFVRESADERRTRKDNLNLSTAINESLSSKYKYDSEKNFSNFEECCKCVEGQYSLESEFHFFKKNQCLVFASVDFHPAAVITLSAIVNNDLQISLYNGKIQVNTLNKLSFPRRITNINDLEEILLELKKLQTRKEDSLILNSIVDHLKCTVLDDDEKQKTLNFVTQQLELIVRAPENLRYSCEMAIFSCILFSISPHSYNFLRSSGNVILPHPRTVRKTCNNFCTGPASEQLDENFLSFISDKFQYLDVSDRTVSLMIDEIYLKPYLDYKGGNILGVAQNSEEAATTAHVFMVQSLLSSFKDVVHILPVKSINAEQLFVFIKKTVIGLYSIGFKVVCVVTDNNSINRKAMTLFSTPPELKIAYCHPSDKTMPLFYVIDSVHIYKCVRNNWLNQKDEYQTILFPTFGNYSTKETLNPASFSSIKALYNLEAQRLVKYAYGLNRKSLFPNNFEKQNVKFVMNIFNQFVIEGLMAAGGEHGILNYKTTAEFIEIICNWWKVVNVKTKYKGVRNKDILEEPLKNQDDNSGYSFLKKILFWLDLWNDCKCKRNSLSRETHLAMTHTTHALLEMTNYCMNELNFEYFLPGKIQTDALEARFGKYRTMAGSHYLVTLRQIFEVESKLRMQNSISLTLPSNTFGEVEVDIEKIDNIEYDCSTDTDVSQFPVAEFEDCLFIETQKDKVECILPVLTYISGYCARSAMTKIKCNECTPSLVLDKELCAKECEDGNSNLIKRMDRGGLKYPTPDVVNVILCSYNIMEKLISKEYELKFLHCSDQRKILFELTFQIVTRKGFFYDNVVCKKNHEDVVLKHLIVASTNILLNNYVKLKNEHICKNQPKRRKLETVKQTEH